MERTPMLVGTGGALKGRRFTVTVEGLKIGREPACEVSIPDANVSRDHARVLLHNSAVWVQDSGSRNGIFVNEKRVVRPKQIGPGDVLSVGGHTFTVEMSGDVPRPSGPRPPTRAEPPSGGDGEPSPQATTQPMPLVARRPEARSTPSTAIVVAVVVLTLLALGATVVAMLASGSG